MTQRIKVLHLCSSFSVGGAERLLVGLADRVDRKRFELHLCSLSVLRGDALRPDFEQIGVPIHVIGAKRFYDPQAVLAIARYIRQHQIDIIHTHLTDADVIGRVVGRMLGLPVVSTLQNEPQDYNRKRFDHRWLERLTARFLATQLIAVSERIRTQFVQEWHIPQDRVTMIYNAVPMEEYLAIPALTPTTDHAPVVTNIGRLSPQKAQHHLLGAAKIVLAQYPEARFQIVGQGRLERPLKEQAEALGIADRVVFTGLRHDIPTVLAESDVFVLSSLWEGLPLTAVEAMAAARPVVLTEVGGNRELVESGTHGLIVPPSDEQALANAILELLNDPARRMQMGNAARARVQHDFNIDTIAAQHEELYQALWSKRYAARRPSHVSAKS